MTAYSHCRFCHGRGCLACDGERKQDIALAHEPVFVAETLEDFELLKEAVGREALEKAVESPFGFEREIQYNLAIAALRQQLQLQRAKTPQGEEQHMDYQEQQQLIADLTANLRRPLHDPVDDEEMPCYEQADLLARLIAAVDEGPDRGLGAFDFRFGGAGDNGEYLIGILDVLLEAGIVTLNTGH